MTKIAIVPNAAGTGTFTIEAPNSNSNRTLVLPDAAGEIYGQGNILGTVSQSAGVPTGAIIERGSNANGEFVKYADGTMICSKFVSITSAVSTAFGSLFETSIITGGNYASTFASTPAEVAAVSRSDTSALMTLVINENNASTAKVYKGIRPTSLATTGTTTVQILATGRWF
jgi:hypothetical protein